jgi:alkylation response protein AidB-like acyl-CoA dehydrogenase
MVEERSKRRLADRALQPHDGYGCSRNLSLEHYARDVRVLRTSEIQRNIIARLPLQ